MCGSSREPSTHSRVRLKSRLCLSTAPAATSPTRSPARPNRATSPSRARGEHVLVGRVDVRPVGAGERDAVAAENGDPTFAAWRMTSYNLLTSRLSAMADRYTFRQLRAGSAAREAARIARSAACCADTGRATRRCSRPCWSAAPVACSSRPGPCSRTSWPSTTDRGGRPRLRRDRDRGAGRAARTCTSSSIPGPGRSRSGGRVVVLGSPPERVPHARGGDRAARTGRVRALGRQGVRPGHHRATGAGGAATPSPIWTPRCVSCSRTSRPTCRAR